MLPKSHFRPKSNLLTLDEELPLLRGLGYDRPQTDLLWQRTPSYSALSPEELLFIPLERVNIASRRRGPASLFRRDFMPAHTSYAQDLDSTNASFGSLTLSTNALVANPTPKTKRDSRNCHPPGLSVLNLGSPRLNTIAAVDQQVSCPGSPIPSPSPLPTSPRWNRQNLPNLA